MKSGAPQYLSAEALADLQLTGLPLTRRGIDRRAEGEGWDWIDRPGQGGGRLYCASSLPAEAREDLARRIYGQRPAPLSRPANDRNIRRGRPKGENFFTARPDIADAVESILSRQKLSAPVVLELLKGQFADLPSLRSLQRFAAQLEKRKGALLLSMRDPDGFKGRHRLALGRADASVCAAHQLWELDTTKADVMTAGGRKMVLGVIDVWSRRARFLIADSESGQSVRRLLVDTIRAWGVMPQAVATDNGAGYINAAIKSALDILGIEHRICPPGSPEKKPHVERLFGTFTRERAELLDGYTGHNVADAQTLRSRAKKETGRAVIVPGLSADQFQMILSNWTEGVYHQRVHGGLRMTPMQKWLSSPEHAAAAADEEVLRVALSALVGTRRVGKRGVVWNSGRYWCAPLAAHMGRDVHVRRDEDELGELFIFDEDYHFIGTAVNAEASGMSEQQFADAARRQFEEHMKAARAEARAKQRRFSFRDARDDMLRRDAEAAGKLTALPVSTITAETRAMRTIANAPVPELPDLPPVGDAPVVDDKADEAQRTRNRIAEVDSLLLAAERGDHVDPDRLRWAQAYASHSTEYQAHKLVQAHFRPAAQPAEQHPAEQHNVTPIRRGSR